MTLWKWSTSPGSNANGDSTINWAEGQAPSSVNDSARAMMAAVAKYRDDLAGTITTGGTATAYTAASNQVFDSLATMSGKSIAFVPHVTNGATVTLNVDGLGAKPLRSAPNVELSAGVLVQGTPYMTTYYNATNEWILVGLANLAWSVPIGALLDYSGSTAPNSQWVLPAGQAISRTTYASYFALVGTTYGAGDGSITFNVPDLRGRVGIGKDDMGGSAANRITSAGSGITGTTLGSVGGSQTSAIAQANLPNVNFSLNTSVVTNVTDVKDLFGTTTNNNQNVVVDTDLSSGSATAASGGSGTPLNVTQPGIILTKILRVL
jgi:microcystin-dependent protein